MNGLNKLGLSNMGSEIAVRDERSIKINLVQQRDQLQERLSKINAALEALNRQPAVAELLETIIKVM